jgi:uncharacterized protein YukE
MNIRTSAGTLQEALKELMARWENVRGQWQDAKAQEFEQQYFEKLPELIRNSVNLMDDIDAVTQKLRRDCE